MADRAVAIFGPLLEPLLQGAKIGHVHVRLTDHGGNPGAILSFGKSP